MTCICVFILTTATNWDSFMILLILPLIQNLPLELNTVRTVHGLRLLNVVTLQLSYFYSPLLLDTLLTLTPLYKVAVLPEWLLPWDPVSQKQERKGTNWGCHVALEEITEEPPKCSEYSENQYSPNVYVVILNIICLLLLLLRKKCFFNLKSTHSHCIKKWKAMSSSKTQTYPC